MNAHPYLSVVAGVMGSNKLFPFMMRDGLSDLNDGTIDGVYYCSSGNETNAPITGRRLIVNVTSFNSRISQMAISEKGESYSRFCYNQVWSAWQRLDNFGYNSLAELSAGVANDMKVRNISFSIGGNSSKTIQFNDKYDGVMSITGTLTDKYLFSYIRGYGQGSLRNDVCSLATGEANEVVCSYDNNTMGFVITNNGEQKVDVVILANSGATLL